MDQAFYVYILASKRNGTLYTGLTNNIARRVYEHRIAVVPGFTRKYDVKRLVHVESFTNRFDAAKRERRLKRWNRAWKIELIERDNPDWDDLYTLISP